MDVSVTEILAEGGDPVAQYNLGNMYEFGENIPPDQGQAVWWYSKAAKQGHVGARENLQRFAESGYAEAQFGLASIYEFGEGAPVDYGEAVKWYRRAAEQGYIFARYSLGSMYMHGGGVPQDHVEAAKWFLGAAEKGYDLAQSELAFMYAEGRGVPQNDVLAYAWFNVAAAQGHAETVEEARKARDDIANRMTREELARAQSFAQQYWEAYVVPFRN